MSVEKTVERPPPDEIKTNDGEIQMSEDDEKNILAGAADIAGDPVGDINDLDELQDRLMGYKLNTEREAAWIRRLVLPNENISDQEIAETDIGVEFILPSGNTFWRTYQLPDRNWPDDNEFVQMLDHIGHNPSTLDQITGERLDVTYDGDEWILVGLEVDEDGVSETSHTKEWDNRHPTRNPKVLESDDDWMYGVLGVGLAIGLIGSIILRILVIPFNIIPVIIFIVIFAVVAASFIESSHGEKLDEDELDDEDTYENENEES